MQRSLSVFYFSCPTRLSIHFLFLRSAPRASVVWALNCRISAADKHAITLLGVENMVFEDVVIAGAYGHFDLGHAVPGMCGIISSTSYITQSA